MLNRYHVIAENVHTGEQRHVGNFVSRELAQLLIQIWSFNTYEGWGIDTETGEIF